MLSTLAISQLTGGLPPLQSFLVRNCRYVIIPVAVVAGYFALRNPIRDMRYRRFFHAYMTTDLKPVNALLLDFREQMKDLMEKQCVEKQEHTGDVKLQIVEVGMGPGASLEFFPKDSSIIAVEPNPYFVEVLLEKQKTYPQLERVIVGGAEDLSMIEDGSIDAVVSTLVLCTVQDLDKTLGEIKRVLVKGGRFYLFDHVGDTSNRRRYIAQTLAAPIWKIYCDGCHLTRDVKGALRRHGFQLTSIKEDSGSSPYLLNRRVWGYVTKC